MKLAKLLLFSVSAIVFISACTTGNPVIPLSTRTPIIKLIETPTLTPIPTRTLIPPVILRSTPVTTPVPTWVTQFSDPILETLVNRVPDFQDDFSHVCVYRSLKLKKCPSIDEQLYPEYGVSVLNQGWLYFNPDSLQNPFYAHIQDGSLFVSLPEEKDNTDSMVYSPKLIRKNFVLNFDFQFDETQPVDVFRFQFDQSADQSVALDIAKDKTWTFHWGSNNDWNSRTGTYDYFPPERINITLIVRDTECAVYLNNVPLDYFDHCRSSQMVRSVPWAVSFHALSTPGRIASIVIDNVKLWDLDKIRSLP